MGTSTTNEFMGLTSLEQQERAMGIRPVHACDRDFIGTDCRCPACEESKVAAAEAAQEASEGR